MRGQAVGFAASIEKAKAKQDTRNRKCSVLLALESMTPKDRAALTASLLDDEIRHATIETALRESGITYCKAGTISRHRSGGCSCGDS
jgi:hypothetical protein